MRDELEGVWIRKKNIFELKMEISNLKQCKPWSEKDLELALRDLKNNKSWDFEGYANKIERDNWYRSEKISFDNVQQSEKRE